MGMISEKKDNLNEYKAGKIESVRKGSMIWDLGLEKEGQQVASELFKSKSSSLSSCQVSRWSIMSRTENISQPLFTYCDSARKSQKESPLLQCFYSIG